MGNSVIHFVRAQSQQWFDTPPLGVARGEHGELSSIPLGPAMRNLYYCVFCEVGFERISSGHNSTLYLIRD